MKPEFPVMLGQLVGPETESGPAVETEIGFLGNLYSVFSPSSMCVT